MRLTLTTFLTLDGVMQGPGQPDEDRRGRFEHGGWQVPYVDEDTFQLLRDWFTNADAFVLGRRTYEIFAGHWPHVSDEKDPISTRLNTLPKYVVSTTLESLAWHNSMLIKDNVPDEITRLKAQPGNELQVHGSGLLAQTLMAHDLIDEYRLLIYPITLGTGRRLFAESTTAAMRLVEATTTSTGTIVATYQPTGKPGYGSFALDQS
jgi:dihydrofolate reductase